MQEQLKQIREDLDTLGIYDVYLGLTSDFQRNGTKKLMPRILFATEEDLQLYKLVGKYQTVNMELMIEL